MSIFCAFATAYAVPMLVEFSRVQGSLAVVDEGNAWNAQHLQDVQKWVMSSDGWWNYTPQELFEMTSETGRPGCSF